MTNDYKGGLTVEPHAAGAKRLFRFSIHSLLWLMVVAALSLTCFIQYRKLRQTEAALSRSAWAGSEAFIPKGKFRLLVNRIIDDQDSKVIVIRFETNDEKYLTVDGASSITTPSIDGQLYWAEIQILSSYDSSLRRLTTLTRVKSGAGWAGGHSIYTLPPAAKPEEFVNITVRAGVYDLTQPLVIGSIESKPVTLSVK